jgi:hypothetical protein
MLSEHRDKENLIKIVPPVAIRAFCKKEWKGLSELGSLASPEMDLAETSNKVIKGHFTLTWF